MQCLVFNSAVLSMLTASLCDWRYSDADLLIIEVLLDLKQMHCTIAQAECSAKCLTLLC